MTIPHLHSSPENYGEMTRTIDKTSIFTRAEVRDSAEKNRLYDGFLLLREKYVREMKWCPGQETDLDRYDEDPGTKYIIRTDSQGEVSAGLRLTQVTDIHNSLSMDMWAAPIERGQPDTLQGFKRFDSVLTDINAMAAEGKVWDLTRLVTKIGMPNYECSLRERQEGYKDLLRMFGSAMATTGEDSTWIYTASETMQLFLKHGGIANIEVTRDFISPGDTYWSYFCLTDVGQSYAELFAHNPRGGELVKEGYCATASTITTIE